MDEYMTAALNEARTDAREGGIRIGAVLVNVQRAVVATGPNRPLKEGACVMRGEINCLLNASRKLFSLLGMTHVLHAHPLQHVRRRHRTVRRHQGGVRGVRTTYLRTMVARSWSDTE